MCLLEGIGIFSHEQHQHPTPTPSPPPRARARPVGSAGLNYISLDTLVLHKVQSVLIGGVAIASDYLGRYLTRTCWRDKVSKMYTPPHCNLDDTDSR